MSTYEVIVPIVGEIYGHKQMATALAAHLANKIDDYKGDNRERMICNTCWEWVPRWRYRCGCSP